MIETSHGEEWLCIPLRIGSHVKATRFRCSGKHGNIPRIEYFDASGVICELEVNFSFCVKGELKTVLL